MQRMSAAAQYKMPRQTEAAESSAGFVAAALRTGTGAPKGTDAVLASDPWVVAADACLYNRLGLMVRLGIPKDATMGDPELILEAYKKWGSGCVNYLYGDFAFVIVNSLTGEVFCCRDPLGVRPFFYTMHGGSFIFGSELRLVLAAFETRPAVRTEYLLDSLVTEKTEKDKSPYETIYRLPPAHYMLIQLGRANVLPYWRPDPDTNIRLKSEAEYHEMFRELLVRAVSMRCSGVSALGCELSGGLDSSAVTGIAAEAAMEEGIPLHAFSNIFPVDTGIEFKDEQEFIKEMTAFRPISWTGVDNLGIGITDLLKYTMDVQGCFVQQNYNIFNYGLFQAASEKGTSVLLSGFGGDELVSARVAMPWNELISDGAWKVIRDELYYRGITIKSLLKPALLSARYLKSRIMKPAYRTGVFTPELIRKRFENLPLQPAYSRQHKLHQHMAEKYRMPYKQKLADRQLQRISMDHLPQRMEYCYAAAAQFGIEYRYPLLDVNLVLAALAFPPWMKQHHGTNRYLFRQAMAGYVPEAIRQRDDKSGTTIPQTYHSLVNEKDAILGLIKSGSASPVLQEIFDFKKFPAWYGRLVKRDPADMNYLNPGAFYAYLMIIINYEL